VVEVDMPRKRIALTMRRQAEAGAEPRPRGGTNTVGTGRGERGGREARPAEPAPKPTAAQGSLGDALLRALRKTD
jgi:uncharacterized protein